MGRIIGPEPGPTWQEKVQGEAGMLSRATWENFKHCAGTCLQHVPDRTDPQQLAVVFQACVEAFVGGFVNSLCTYGNTTEEFEEDIISEIRLKFRYIRVNEVRLRNDRIQQQAENNAKGKIIHEP